jgi:N-acetylglucosamine kinase-like BadF-type ATPase
VERLEVVNDALGALRAGTPDGVGLAVVCGTGGCVGARSAEGKAWHSSWWGLDTGGGAIGSAALGAVFAAELSMAPPTSLTRAALEFYDAGTVEELLFSFMRRHGRPAAERAWFAPAVLREAAAGDPVAGDIVAEQGRRLGEVARAAVRVVGLDGPFPLVLLGGVFRGAGAELLRAELQARVPDGVPVATRFEPAAGALLTAFDLIGATPDEARLHETFPGVELFASA